jgi:hypothetical protein
MNDTLHEETIKRTPSSREKLENIGILAVGIVGIFLAFVIFKGFFVIPVTVILIIEYFVLLPRCSIEIEYSFFDNVLEISYIYNKEKRKTKLEIDMRNAEIIAPTNSEKIRAYHSQKELDFSSGEENRDTYSIMVRLGSQLTQVIIEPDEKMLLLLKKSVRMKGH